MSSPFCLRENYTDPLKVTLITLHTSGTWRLLKKNPKKSLSSSFKQAPWNFLFAVDEYFPSSCCHGSATFIIEGVRLAFGVGCGGQGDSDHEEEGFSFPCLVLKESKDSC